jgi:NTE family protein
MWQSTTLVLGGGGVWGLGWMTGLIAGLAEEGIDVRQAGTLIGTSAGSVMAAQLCGDRSIEELFRAQTEVALQTQEQNAPPEGFNTLMKVMTQAWPTPEARVRAICEQVVPSSIDPVKRRVDIAARLGASSLSWPARSLKITAVDIDSFALHVFDATSGVDLVDAVAASCAVPGVWPSVPLQGRRYVDGGVWRTSENAHLASAAARVLICAPFADAMRMMGTPTLFDRELAELRAGGSQVTVIAADADSLACVALGPLNLATRAPAARAGRAQGRRVAEQVRQAVMAGGH